MKNLQFIKTTTLALICSIGIQNIYASSAATVETSTIPYNSELSNSSFSENLSRQAKEVCYQEDKYVIAKNGLNFRKSPKVGDNIIKKLPFGTLITTLAPVKDGWVQIVVSDPKDSTIWQEGYVSIKYLSDTNPLLKTSGNYKTTDNVYLRTSYGTNSKAIGKLQKHDKFKIYENIPAKYANGHYFRKIKITNSKDKSLVGKTGWMAIKYSNAPRI